MCRQKRLQPQRPTRPHPQPLHPPQCLPPSNLHNSFLFSPIIPLFSHISCGNHNSEFSTRDINLQAFQVSVSIASISICACFHLIQEIVNLCELMSLNKFICTYYSIYNCLYAIRARIADALLISMICPNIFIVGKAELTHFFVCLFNFVWRKKEMSYFSYSFIYNYSNSMWLFIILLLLRIIFVLGRKVL